MLRELERKISFTTMECEFCKKKYASKYTLKRHLEKSHPHHSDDDDDDESHMQEEVESYESNMQEEEHESTDDEMDSLIAELNDDEHVDEETL